MQNRNPISYSLWLIPEPTLNKKLKLIIDLLAHKYKGPRFPPHITLLHDFKYEKLDFREKIKNIVNQIQPFNVFFKKVRYKNEFFESLFLDVRIDKQLHYARKIVSQDLECEEKKYNPHLSLLYGNYNEIEKQKMVSLIKPIPNFFLVDRIFLAHNNEVKLKWKVIEEFNLCGKNK
mgnify:CR=1 FL=1